MARKRDDVFILGAEPLEPPAGAAPPAAQSGSRNPFAPAPEPQAEQQRAWRLPRRPAATVGLIVAVVAAVALLSRALGGGEPSAPVRQALAPAPPPSAVLAPPRAQISRPPARAGRRPRQEAGHRRKRPARRRASRSEPTSLEPSAPLALAPAPVVEVPAPPAQPDPPAAEPVEPNPPPNASPPSGSGRPEFSFER